MNKVPLSGLLTLFAICSGGESGDGAGVVISDSSGIELVRMSAAFVSTVPELSPRENLRIGAVDGPPEYQFFRVWALAEADDGTVFVLDGGNHVVRAFGSSGDFLHEFGSEGHGPGTFEAPFGLTISGDTIAVVDRRLIHLFELDGTFIEAGAPRLRPGENFWRLDATAAGWRVATRSPAQRGAGTGPFTDTTYVHEFDPGTGTPGEGVFAYPLQGMYRLGPMRFGVVPLFEPLGQHEVDREGMIYFTRGDGYEIEVRGASGALDRRITADIPRVSIAQAVIDMYIDITTARLRQSWGNRPAGDIARKAYLEDQLELDGPDVRPVIGRLFASAKGELLADVISHEHDPGILTSMTHPIG